MLRCCLPLLPLLLLALAGRAQTALRVAGATPLVAPFQSAVPLLANQQIELKVAGNGTSTAVITAVGENDCDLGITTRPVTAVEHSNYPDEALAETVIGYQALVFTVSNDVWGAGIRSLGRADMQAIYESRVTDWAKLGGPSHPIKFFNPEKGKGVWEFFATWLYGDMRKAPIGAVFESVETVEETRNVVEFNGGALALLPPARADSKGTHALAVRDEDGSLIAPTPSNIRSHRYPIVRPVIVVTAFRPSGIYKQVIDFMLSAQGQLLVKNADIVPVMEEERE